MSICESSYSILVPQKSGDLQFYDFDNQQKMIHQTKLGYRIVVDNDSFNLLNLINGELNIEEIAILFNNCSVTPSTIYNVIINKFQKYGVVYFPSSTIIEAKKRQLHLRLSITILNRANASKIIHRLNI